MHQQVQPDWMTSRDTCHDIHIDLDTQEQRWIFCQLLKSSHIPPFLVNALVGDCIMPLIPSWNTDQGVEHVCRLRCWTAWLRDEDDEWDICTRYYLQMLGACDGVCMLGPERWWTMSMQGKVRGNPDGGLHWYWRANCSQHIDIGVKDSSNYLVAGSLWNIPQDSWSQITSLGKVND